MSYCHWMKSHVQVPSMFLSIIVTWCFMPSQPVRLYQGDLLIIELRAKSQSCHCTYCSTCLITANHCSDYTTITYQWAETAVTAATAEPIRERRVKSQNYYCSYNGTCHRADSEMKITQRWDAEVRVQSLFLALHLSQNSGSAGPIQIPIIKLQWLGP